MKLLDPEVLSHCCTIWFHTLEFHGVPIVWFLITETSTKHSYQKLKRASIKFAKAIQIQSHVSTCYKWSLITRMQTIFHCTFVPVRDFFHIFLYIWNAIPLKTQPYVVYISLEYIEETVSYVLSFSKRSCSSPTFNEEKSGEKSIGDTDTTINQCLNPQFLCKWL